MIVVSTEKDATYKVSGSKINHYLCPHCKADVPFGSYIRTICEKCNGTIFNVEKVLDDIFDTGKVNYYINEKI